MNISKAALNEIIEKLSNTDALNCTGFAKELIDLHEPDISESNLRKSLKLVHKVLQHLQNSETPPHLKLVKQKLDKDGNVTSETLAVRKENEISTEGMEVVGVTTAPFGSYVKYKASQTSFLTDDYLQRIKELLTKYIEPVFFEGNNESEDNLTIVLTDRHIGAALEKPVLYENQYDAKEYGSRMSKVLFKIQSLNQKTKGFDNLNIIDLADTLDGMDSMTVSRRHTLEQNMTNQEAWECYIENEKKLIDAIVETTDFNKLTYTIIANGNHDGDFFYTAARAFQIYVEAKYPNVEIKVLTGFLNHVKLNGEDYILTHGKSAQHRKSGLPLNIDNKTELFLKEFAESKGVTGRFRVLKGDLHQYAVNSTNSMDYINCPSLFGFSNYISHNYSKSKYGFYFELNNSSQVEWLD